MDSPLNKKSRPTCQREQRWRAHSSGTEAAFTRGGGEQMELKLSGSLQVHLEHVLGMTLNSRAALALDPHTGIVAFPAGSVLVMLDGIKYKQVGTLQSPGKSITSAQFSPDGRYVVTGEAGLRPAVRVWEVQEMKEVGTLMGHSFGITSVTFTPRMHEIIAVGEPRDMTISVWAWPGKYMRAQNKFTDEIYAMAVAEDSSFFITVGNRHVKFYYLEKLLFTYSTTLKKCPIPLVSHSGNLDTLMENSFCDVICGTGSSRNYIYVVSVSGVLIQINEQRRLERWVNVNMTTATCLAGSDDLVLVGGAQGTIRMFRSVDLEILASLPHPHSLGLDIAQVVQDKDLPDEKEDPPLAEEVQSSYPTTHSMAYDPGRQTVTAIFDNRSLYVWQANRDFNTFNKRHSRMYHSRSVWAMASYPHLQPLDEEGGLVGALPPGALLSISSDGTLRAWDVFSRIGEASILKRNCVSEECLKIVYVGADKQLTRGRQRSHGVKTGDLNVGPGGRHDKQVFTILAICPEGKDIAIGNRSGKISIYDANSMVVKAMMAAHDSDVTALCYSQTKSCKILASGSRDRMIHVTDASRNYKLLTTLDDHSSTLTAIHFTEVGKSLLMVSSSLDMSVLVRAFVDKHDSYAFKPVRAIVEKKAIMDLTIHPTCESMALACADRQVRVYSILSSADNSYSFRGCPPEGGQLIKIEIDPSGHFLLTACSNKTINILQFRTGRLLLSFPGHAETISCVLFSHNMKYVVSSACDGCVFFWRLPESMTYFVKSVMAEKGRLPRGMVLNGAWTKGNFSQLQTVKDEIHTSETNIVDGKNRVETEHDQVYEVSRNEVDSGSTDESKSQQQSISEDVNVSIPKLNPKSNTSPAAVVPSTEFIKKKTDSNICDPPLAALPNSPRQETSEHHVNQGTSKCMGSPKSWSRRRENFKLEYKSIKKMLSVMKLVTDAMEKDLERADDALCSRRNSPSRQKKCPRTKWDCRCTGDFQTSTANVLIIDKHKSPVKAQGHPNETYSSVFGSKIAPPDVCLLRKNMSEIEREKCIETQPEVCPPPLPTSGNKSRWQKNSQSCLDSSKVNVRRLSHERVNVSIFTQKTPNDVNHSNVKSEHNFRIPAENISELIDDDEDILTHYPRDPYSSIDVDSSMNKITFQLSSERGDCQCVGAVVFDDSADTEELATGGNNRTSRLLQLPSLRNPNKPQRRQQSTQLFPRSFCSHSPPRLNLGDRPLSSYNSFTSDCKLSCSPTSNLKTSRLVIESQLSSAPINRDRLKDQT